MKTGIAIAIRREQIGMTQDELAKAVGVSKASISRWESKAESENDATQNATQDTENNESA